MNLNPFQHLPAYNAALTVAAYTDLPQPVEDAIQAPAKVFMDPVGSVESAAKTIADGAESVLDAIGSLFDSDEPPPDPRTTDSDGDGLTDWQEQYELGTDPHLRDTDGDGLTDLEELDYGTDPLDPDSDGDGLIDAFEKMSGTDPWDWDSDDDGWSDGLEVLLVGTDPLDVDTDGDGLTDREEGMIYRTSPVNPDTDADGLDDWHELDKGYDPLNPDTDGDGKLDGIEAEERQITVFDHETAEIATAPLPYETEVVDGVVRETTVWPSNLSLPAITFGMGSLNLMTSGLAG